MDRIDRSYYGAVFLDLDGTLLDAESRVGPVNAAALEALAKADVARIAVTGRSLYSALRVLDERTPIDLLVVSSGATVLDWPRRRKLDERWMNAPDVERATSVLEALELDFMVHGKHPDNHHFAYWASPQPCADFARRVELYTQFARELARDEPRAIEASQLLAIRPGGDDTGAVHADLSRQLSGLTVIRTTSPLDHSSTWFELFPPDVSKGGASERIRSSLGLDADRCMAVGNDYNDLSLLEWCAHPFVVANAPPALRARFPVVAHHDEGGVAEAVRRWLA